MAKLFKRGRIWFAWVPKRGGGVKRVTTYCTDKRAAELALRQLERDAVDPASAAARTTTTQRILDDYLRSRLMKGRSEETIRYVRQKAGVLLSSLPARAAELTHARLSHYVQTRLAEGAMRTTVKKELGVLKPALKLARKNGLWIGDAEDVIPELDDDYRPRSRALTPWELVGLCSVLPESRAAHVAFIASTGARWGESLRALWHDHQGQHTMRLRGTKTRAAARVVPIPILLRSVFAWSLHWSPGKWDDSRPLFDAWANVRRDLAQACAKLGIAPVSPNDLRRTFGTWLREAGVEPQLIGAAMGHTTSRMVEMVYGRLTPDALGALLDTRLAGTYAGGTDDVSGELTALPARSDDRDTEPVSAGSSEFTECTGAELNCRHADFQSVPSDGGKPCDVAASAANPIAHQRLGGTYVGVDGALWSPSAAAMVAGLLGARG